MKVIWSRRARNDLREIGDYIGRDDREQARIWLRKLWERVNRVSSVPRSGRVVPEYRRDDVREVFLKTYRIMYRVVSGRLFVLTVLEGHRMIHDDLAMD